MNLHDAISELNDVFFDTDVFAETVEHWPLGVEANAVEVDAIVDWDRANLNESKGTTETKSDATIMLAVSVAVTVGKDVFCLTDPESAGTVKLVVVSVDERDEAAQTLSLRRLDAREYARPGYRR